MSEDIGYILWKLENVQNFLPCYKKMIKPISENEMYKTKPTDYKTQNLYKQNNSLLPEDFDK